MSMTMILRSVKSQKPYSKAPEIHPVIMTGAIAQIQTWHDGLEQQFGPQGNDTEVIIEMCELRYPVKPYNDEKQVAHLRRELYKSILYLRTKGMWILDGRVSKTPVKPGVLN